MSIARVLVLAALIAGCARGQNHVLSLDGDEDHVEVQHSPALAIAGVMTVEAWIKIDSYPSHPAVIVTKMQRSPWEGFSLHLQGGFLFMAAFRAGLNPPYEQVSADWSTIAPRQWTHVAGVARPASLDLFVNGALVGSSPVQGGVSGTGAAYPLRIGYDAEAPTYNPDSELTGLVDEVRLWSVDRSGAEIAAGMHVELDGLPGLVASWHFDGNLLDNTGGHVGTLIGGALVMDPGPWPILPPAVTLSLSQPLGSGSLTLDVTAPTQANLINAFSLEPLNALQPGTGWWGGLHISLPDLAIQVGMNGPPFVGVADSSGAWTFSLPSGSLPVWLPNVYAVTHSFDSTWVTISGTSTVEFLDIQ